MGKFYQYGQLSACKNVDLFLLWLVLNSKTTNRGKLVVGRVPILLAYNVSI